MNTCRSTSDHQPMNGEADLSIAKASGVSPNAAELTRVSKHPSSHHKSLLSLHVLMAASGSWSDTASEASCSFFSLRHSYTVLYLLVH
jgi:hypothetical protein